MEMNTVKTTTTIDNCNVNYCQVVPLTFEEKVNMYMKCTKLDLARMLAERDRIEIPSQPYIYPWQPTTPMMPYPFEPIITCEEGSTCYASSVSTEDYENYCKLMNKSDN